jgi:hypothetical protein
MVSSGHLLAIVWYFHLSRLIRFDVNRSSDSPADLCTIETLIEEPHTNKRGQTTCNYYLSAPNQKPHRPEQETEQQPKGAHHDIDLDELPPILSLDLGFDMPFNPGAVGGKPASRDILFKERVLLVPPLAEPLVEVFLAV